MKQADSDPSGLEIDLGRPVAEQRALDWPVKHGEPSELHAIQSPRQVTLRLPGGRSFTAPSQLTTLDQRDGRLASVILQPPPEPLQAEACIAALRALLAANDLLDSEVSDTLDSWGERAAPIDRQFAPTLSTRIVADGTSILATMRLLPGRGWFYTLDFEPRR